MEGLHLTADCFDCECDQTLLTDQVQLSKIITTITENAGLNIVDKCFYPFKNSEGQAAGVTGTLLLAESHVAIHTWPERNAVTLDAYVCNFHSDNSGKARAIIKNLIAVFLPKTVSQQELQRGLHIQNALEHLSPHTSMQTRIDEVIAQVHSPYQQIEIASTPEFGKIMRIDGAMMTSEKDEFFYHECLVHPAAISHGNPRTALIIGGGDGGSSKQLLKYACMESITLCEIDAAVIRLSKEHLHTIHGKAFADPRLKIMHADGFAYIQDCEKLFDLILLDLTDPISPNGSALAANCMNTDFFHACYERLDDGGSLVLHLGSPFYHAERFSKTLEDLKKAFNNIYPYTVFIPLYGAVWGMAIATKTACDTQHISPCLLSATAVKQRIEHHRLSTLQYYNAEVHQALFALPNYVKALV